MFKAILILLALAAVQASAATCDTRAAAFASGTLSGCTREPCMLKRGSIVNYSLKFTPTTAISDLTAHVKASRFGISITFLDRAPVCGKIFRVSDNSPAPCPLIPGVEYIYRDTFPIPKRPPATQGTVQLAIKIGTKIVKCVEVGVKIRV